MANWAAINTRAVNANVELAVEARVARQPRARANPPIQFYAHLLDETRERLPQRRLDSMSRNAAARAGIAGPKTSDFSRTRLLDFRVGIRES